MDEDFLGEPFLCGYDVLKIPVIENGVPVWKEKFPIEKIEKLKKWFEELMRKNTENIKKKVAEQGLASLSADELERFKIQNPTEYERLTQNQQKVESNNEELQALTDTLKQDFIKQIKEQSLSLIDIRA